MMLFINIVILLFISSANAFKLDLNVLNPRDSLDIMDYFLDNRVSERSIDNLVMLDSSNPNQLLEFTPIKSTLNQSQKQYFQYNVNNSGGLGEGYAYLILLSGNICVQPTEKELSQNNVSLTVYYSFNSLIFENLAIAEMLHFSNGYLQAMVDVPTVQDTSGYSTLYIVVQAPENTNKTIQWSYQIGVSQNSLVYQWDDRTWSRIIDTDENLALIATGNLTLYNNNFNTSSTNALDLSLYHLYIYSDEYKDYFKLYNRSWCAVKNGPYLLLDIDFETSYTSRSGGLQQQFYVTGLNASTTYIAYLVLDNADNTYGGTLYAPFEFTTMDYNACELIYDLEFCNRVAYSVPARLNQLKDEISILYDNQAKSLYQNFLKALQQIACNTTDNAKFSPLLTCDDCASAYKDWLCSVTIPRCLTHNVTGYKYREVGESRNDFINNEIQPDMDYFEVLPCIQVCQDLARICPADFGFQCPTKNSSIELSYYWFLEGSEYYTCNYFGFDDS